MTNTFKPISLRPIQLVLVILLALAALGCSGSSGSSASDDSDEDSITVPSGSDTTSADTVETVVGITTRVQFDITVPTYQSNALQVRLQWGDQNMLAEFVVDESWEVVADLTTNTENTLTVTFSDNNGAITIGSVEQIFRTGTNSTESLQITAEQFDTDRWDNDGDGISNLAELIAGTSSDGEALPQAVQASLELMPTKIIRFNWNMTTDALWYRVLENPDGVSGFSPISDSLESSTVSFNHPVALYNRVNARYIVQACNTNGCVDSNELTLTSTLDSAIGFVKASNAGSDDEFGFSVSLSADGSTLAVGAPFEDGAAFGINGEQSDDYAPRAGAAYVFIRSNGTWQQQAYLKASNTNTFDLFGSEVSLNADGDTLAVGAAGEESAATGINADQTDNSMGRAGAVYVFVRNEGLWQQQSYLKASNTGSEDFFGRSVSLSADGRTLAVGASSEDSTATGINGDQFASDNPSNNSGAVYVFVHSDGLWQQQAYVKASNTDNSDVFGTTVSLSTDGSTLAVGAIGESSAATGINGDQSDNSIALAGAVYVFVRSDGLWQQQAYLKASNTDAGDFFGSSISLNADGSTLAVSTPAEDSAATGINGDQTDNSAGRSGAVFVFIRSNGLWRQQAYVKASNTGSPDNFGKAVSLSADSNTLAVGATGEDTRVVDQSVISPTDLGAVYLY